MVNDRGNIKWTTLMLPEHAEILRELRIQQSYKTKPILDEQLIEENELKLQQAIQADVTIEVKYFKEHNFHFIKGKLRNINANGKGHITFENEDRTEISFHEIIEVKLG
ncbi:YolD-like family protein [Oceanobacillus sp. CAU 1775]